MPNPASQLEEAAWQLEWWVQFFFKVFESTKYGPSAFPHS
jgi:hypothetical protein